WQTTLKCQSQLEASMNAETVSPRTSQWNPWSWLWLFGLILLVEGVMIGQYIQRAYAAANAQAWQTAPLRLPLGRHSRPVVDSLGRAWFFTQASQLVAYTLDGQQVSMVSVPGVAQLTADPTQVRVAVGPNFDPWLTGVSGNQVLHDDKGHWVTYTVD